MVSYPFIHVVQKLVVVGYMEVVYPSKGSHVKFFCYLSDADAAVAVILRIFPFSHSFAFGAMHVVHSLLAIHQKLKLNNWLCSGWIILFFCHGNFAANLLDVVKSTDKDGNQRTQGTPKWTYYLYDIFGRLAQQGECTGKDASSNTVVHVRNYYDDYSFVGGTGFPAGQFPP